MGDLENTTGLLKGHEWNIKIYSELFKTLFALLTIPFVRIEPQMAKKLHAASFFMSLR